jgi:N-acyl-D-amino-acid deacylase
MGTANLLVMMLGMVGDAPSAASPAPAEARVRPAVERSLTYLQEEAVDWIRDRKCAACHHAPMMIWAVHEAQARGYAIDRGAVAEVTSWTLDDPVQAKMLTVPKPAAPGSKPSAGERMCLNTGYTTLAARAVPPRALGAAARAALERMEAHLVAMQQEDGSWAHGGGRPPALESREITTLMNCLALAARPEADTVRPSPAAASLKKAAEWLARTPPASSLQARVLRLLVDLRTGTASERRGAAIDEILARQNADGGFGQEQDLPSDAYATGQALYALSLAGVCAERSEIVRARAFLVRTQNDDGSWPMSSRPVQPGGGPAKDLNPITFLGTAWATLGLVRSSPH